MKKDFIESDDLVLLSNEVKKFKTSDKIIPINFDVRKGNPKANDSDGGNITAISFNSKYENIGKVIFENLKYDENFVFEWDKSKDIAHADDNDSFFDGGVEKKFCGAVKHKKKWDLRNLGSIS